MGPLTLARRLRLRAEPGDLWPLVADTDRVNRALGFPPVSHEPLPDGLARKARTRLLGFIPLSWTEPPSEWVEGRFYEVRRLFDNGPFRETLAGVRFSREPGGTGLEIFAELAPRGWAWRAARPALERSLDRFAGLCVEFEASLRGAEAARAPRRAGRGKARAAPLERALAPLRGRAEDAALDRLRGHLLEAPDEDVVGMRPFALADLWGLDRLKTLAACLHAAKAGALDASWEVLCPHCRVPKAGYETLSKFRKAARCEVCRVDFAAEFDRNVELRFTAHPSIREARARTYCISGPRNTPHRAAQFRVEAGASRAVRLELPPGRFLLRELAGGFERVLRPDPAGGSVLAVALPEARTAPPSEAAFRPGPVELTIENRAPRAAWLALDREAWSDQAATAALVTALQDFRDLFSSEVLSPEEDVGLKSLAILFTDIKGSTALYERTGDAPAYAMVRDHFKLLTEATRECRGAVVKTIGDAVMAAFAAAEDAAAAACLIQRRFEAFNRDRRPGREELVVKVGGHCGPVLAINNRGVMDYFGTTVNVAARVQSESVGGDVVLSDAAYQSARTVLERERCEAEPFEIALKGLSGTFRLWRLRPGARADAGKP